MVLAHGRAWGWNKESLKTQSHHGKPLVEKDLFTSRVVNKAQKGANNYKPLSIILGVATQSKEAMVYVFAAKRVGSSKNKETSRIAKRTYLKPPAINTCLSYSALALCLPSSGPCRFTLIPWLEPSSIPLVASDEHAGYACHVGYPRDYAFRDAQDSCLIQAPQLKPSRNG